MTERPSRPHFSRGDASSPVSTLKVWITTDLGAGKLGIQCPHKDCGGKAVVNKRKWINSKKEYIGRSCTYCYKTSQLPDGLK